MKKILKIIVFVIISILIFLSGCNEQINQGDEPSDEDTNDLPFLPGDNDFSIHEWGVFVKGLDCTDTSALAEAPNLVYAKKPIIYFHGVDNKTNINILISPIENTTTIPFAQTKSNSPESINLLHDFINWDIIVENDTIVGYEFPNLPQEFRNYSHLFYEGEINYSSNLSANVTPLFNYNQYIVKNPDSVSLSNVFFVYGYNNFLNSENNFLNIISFDEIIPGEEQLIYDSRTGKIKNVSQVKKQMYTELISRNLTEDESNDLISYWQDWWFYPTNNGFFTRLIYFIPENIYDDILPINITPKPSSIDRVGIFTVTDIPIITNYTGVTMYVTSTIKLGTRSFSYFIDGDTMEIGEVNIIIKNPNNVSDTIDDIKNNTFKDLTNAKFKWVDRNGDSMIGDDDELIVYNDDGLILGEWKITIKQKTTNRILLFKSINITSN